MHTYTGEEVQRGGTFLTGMYGKDRVWNEEEEEFGGMYEKYRRQ